MPEANRRAPVDRLAAIARDALPGEVTEAEHERGRERLLASVAERHRPPTHTAVWLVAAAMLGLIVASVGLFWPSSRLGYTAFGAKVTETGYVATTSSAGATVRFTDGSEINFESGARSRIADVTAHGARIVIESGRASVHVAHLPKAAWSVEAGPFVVAVTGTEFDVTWSTAEQVLDVHLRTGSVTVSGPLAPSGVALQAGQRLVARMPTNELRIAPADAATTSAPSPSTSPDASATDAALASPPTAPAAASGSSDARAPTSWSKRVAHGDFRGVLDDAEARGIDACLTQSSLADLTALADAARYDGNADVARRSLVAQRSRFPGSTEAKTAAFLLGRMADDRGATAEAKGWYDAYLAEAPSGAFAAEALGRKMIAVQRASGDAAARPIAEEYLGRFPAGPHAASAHALTGH